jgi:hypothetical protein
MPATAAAAAAAAAAMVVVVVDVLRDSGLATPRARRLEAQQCLARSKERSWVPALTPACVAKPADGAERPAGGTRQPEASSPARRSRQVRASVRSVAAASIV